MTQFNIPILFLIFNRPDTTQKVFDVIREIRPKQLFIAADGPRKNKSGEIQKCNETRTIVNQINWECEIKTLFRDENLGCGMAVSSAITWFFENVEEGIILEDDCLPHPSFFSYCEELLDRYRDNDEVMLISGSNRYDKNAMVKTSYYFLAVFCIWGWATWRSAWKKYEYDINKISKKQLNAALKYYFKDNRIRRYWRWIFYLLRKHQIDTWDYQFAFCVWINKGLSIAPYKNLISNIGFGENATHTLSNYKISNLPTFTIEDINHSLEIKRCVKADEYYITEGKCSVNIFRYVYAYFWFLLKSGYIKLYFPKH